MRDRSYAMKAYTSILEETTMELVNYDTFGLEASAFSSALVVARLNEMMANGGMMKMCTV